MKIVNPRRLLEVFYRELARELPNREQIDSIARILIEKEPKLRWIVRASLLHGYLTSARNSARLLVSQGAKFPTDNPAPMSPAITPPSSPVGVVGTPDSPRIRFPAIDAATDWLARRRLITEPEFRELDAQSQSAAFTIARLKTVESIQNVRDAVQDVVRVGATLPQFRETVRTSVEDAFSPSQVETLFRTHVGLAQAAGKRAIIENPMVIDEFPYLMWSATHDDRTRPDHRAMEKHGQNGTAIYRRDDPMWETLWPPAGWNCRCEPIPLTIEDAARYGSREAARWLRTGERPLSPDWAQRPYPIILPRGWPSHRGIVAVA